MQSKKIILLVNGKHKQKIMKQFMSKQISSKLPASILWLHPDVTAICDEDSMKKI